MNFKFLLFLLVAITLISCEKKPIKIDISYDSETQSGILLVDGQTKIKLPKDSLSITASILPGEHKFKLNKDKEFTITIADVGGILNLDNQRFVTVQQDYGTSEEQINTYNMMRVKNEFIIADSIVFFYREDSLQEVSDADIRNAIAMDKKFDGSSNTMKLYEAQKFIPKDWNYGLNEEFPESIEQYTKSTDVFRTATRTKILPLNLFVTYAYLNPANFVIRSLKEIEAGATDKEVDKTKTNKQMEME